MALPKLTDSSKRALRTGFHVLLALLSAIPALVAGLPAVAVGANVLVVASMVSKGLNYAEEAGLIPAWLKSTTPIPVVEAPAATTDAPAQTAAVDTGANVDGATDPDGPTG